MTETNEESGASNTLEPKFHKIEIFNKNPGEVMSGRSTKVLIDGKPLKGCCSFRFVVDAQSIAKVYLELVADVSILADVEIVDVQGSLKDATHGVDWSNHKFSQEAINQLKLLFEAERKRKQEKADAPTE